MMWLKLLIAGIVILACICIYYVKQSCTHFHKVYYRLSSDKISKPVKFVFLSDLHDKEYGVYNRDLFRAVEEEKPDGVFVSGDMLTAYSDRNVCTAEQVIAGLASQYPVYYGLGNHEAKMGWSPQQYQDNYEKYMLDMHNSGAVMLSNKNIKLPAFGICVHGLDLPRKYYKRLKKMPMDSHYIEELLGSPEEHYFNILLAHNPSYFDAYAAWKADLVLSGHVHGGLVRLPFLGGVIAPSLEIFPKYDGGKYTQNKSTMILSRGLGYHSIEFRMWNPGELVVIELVPAEE